MNKKFVLEIDESVINQPGSGVIMQEVTTGDAIQPEAEPGSFHAMHEFSATRQVRPENRKGMASGSQHPGFDSPPGRAVNYYGFWGDNHTNGWNIERMSNGTPYFRAPNALEFMKCPHESAPVGDSNTYPIIKLPTTPQ